MQQAAATTEAEVPQFSIVIPLEFHRDRWERCLQAWREQSVADELYELVLVVPRDFEERDLLATAAAQPGCICRVVDSDLRHDIGLCTLGAEHARGKYLFFTEAHCWPEPDVLALCLSAFDQHRDWAGFSCHSLPVTSNRLADAEAAMYDADIAHGMTVHPWRKILDQCFATRRTAYARSGGFKPEFGHFAEWALAASYHELGLAIGYLPEARVHHQYIGDLRVLRQFTRDFFRGEVRYLTQAAEERGSHLIEVPGEWLTHGNFDRTLAKAMLTRALNDARNGADCVMRRESRAAARRWLVPAIFGSRLRRIKPWIAMSAMYVRVRLVNLFGSSRSLNDAFRDYFEATAHFQRLSSAARADKTYSTSAPATSPLAFPTWRKHGVLRRGSRSTPSSNLSGPTRATSTVR
jgi:hypothetical protein